jgi:hypothetical protein
MGTSFGPVGQLGGGSSTSGNGERSGGRCRAEQGGARLNSGKGAKWVVASCADVGAQG